jgi:predicted O-methyltransferase YrrM
MKKIDEHFSQYMNKNARRNSMRHVSDYILNNTVKNIVEFGTSRVDYEGNSTIFHAILARENNISFTSVDIVEEYLENAKQFIKNFDEDLLNYINFVCDCQYNFMKNYSGDLFQCVYLDCDDLKKHNALKTLIECESNMLDNEALIYIDDMIFTSSEDEVNKNQVYGVVDIINTNSKLTPVDKSEEYILNSQQNEWYNNNLINSIPDNCKVYNDGVRQFEYQILAKYKK